MTALFQEGSNRAEEAAAIEAGPTRRALLALLPASFLDGPDAASDPPLLRRAAGSRSIKRCWADLVSAITEQDRAIDRRDRLERLLLRHFESACPSKAADPAPHNQACDTEECFVAVGQLLGPLLQSLADRRTIWEQGAALVGLHVAEDMQALASSIVKHAAFNLIRQPAKDLSDLRLKLTALLAVHEPGADCRQATPWRELRIILADVEGLLHAMRTPMSIGSPASNQKAYRDE